MVESEILIFDVSIEKPITLADAAKLVPSAQKPGQTVSVNTVRRWIRRGQSRPRDRSQVIKLQAVYIGGSLFTSVESIARFAKRLTASDENVRSPEEVQTANDAAFQRLLAAGY